MISSVNFNPAVVFTAAPPPRRDLARDEAPADNGGQDAFNRMLAQQRDAARLNSKLASPPPMPTQAPAPEQPPMQIPGPGQGPGPVAKESGASKDKPATPGGDAAGAESTVKSAAGDDQTGSPDPAKPGPDSKAKIRPQAQTPSQAAANAEDPADPEDRLPKQDLVQFYGNDRHAYHTKMLEMNRQAKLAQTTTKQEPGRLPPFGPEGPPEGTPRCPPGADPAEHELDNPTPPLIECPVEPMMATMLPLAAAKASGSDAVERKLTQELQAQAADVRTAPAAADALQAKGDGTAAAAVAAAQAIATSEPVSAITEAQARSDRVELAGAPALALATPGAATPTATAPTAKHATLDARPGSEAFASKFSAQVAVWVREGVHEAQLQLNPADMGPVRVAILLEGAAAQVNFTAEHSLTRQALEQALPTLAGTLAEAGFTLAGGGVFDQPRQPERGTGEPARNAGGTNRAADTDSGTEPARAAAARPRGVVDLVA